MSHYSNESDFVKTYLTFCAICEAAKDCEALILEAFGQTHPQWEMIHALVMALAGYTSTFKNVIIAVPSEIGERRDRNGTLLPHVYSFVGEVI